MAKSTDEHQREAKLAGIPESTRRIMERMVNTPPQPHKDEKPKREKDHAGDKPARIAG